jgi:hypothetical protein
MAKWVVLVLFIQHIPCSGTVSGWRIAMPIAVFHSFHQYLQGNAKIVPQIIQWSLSGTSLPVYYLSFILYFTAA